MLTIALGFFADLVTAQEKSDDQVGLVFPAFFTDDGLSDGALGQSVAFALKLTVQSDLSSEDPITNERGYGRGISFYVPATMSEASHAAAARLARINGLQGTVWGYATELVDGIAIQPYLTVAPSYEDYRETRQEIWEAEVGDAIFRLGPPQRTVAFLPETVPTTLVSSFGDPATIDYCREDGGGCVRFADAQIARVWSVADDGTARIRRERVDYIVKLPTSDLYTSEAVDYANLFVASVRGNLNQAVDYADIYLERHGPSGTAIDAHLFKAAALARMGRTELADIEVRAALELNPVARRSLRYGIMLELVRTGQPTERSQALFETLASNYGLTDPFDRLYSEVSRSVEP